MAEPRRGRNAAACPGREANGENGPKADRVIGREKAEQPVRPEAEPVAPVDFVDRRSHHVARQDEKRPDGVEAHVRGVSRSRKVRKDDDQREDETKCSGQGTPDNARDLRSYRRSLNLGLIEAAALPAHQ